MHDLVALLEDVRATHCESGRPLVLRRGQVGTVVMTYDGPVVDVEFSGQDGRAYAIVPINVQNLLALKDTPNHAVTE
jgi:hypothetical protein